MKNSEQFGISTAHYRQIAKAGASTSEISEEQYEQPDEVVRETNTTCRNVKDFVQAQVEEALDKHEKWKQTAKNRTLKKRWTERIAAKH